MHSFSTEDAGNVLDNDKEIPESAATQDPKNEARTSNKEPLKTENEARTSDKEPLETKKYKDYLEMKIEKIMSREVFTIRKETPLKEVFTLFEKYRFHTFPVVDSENNLMGIIDQDIILEILLFAEVPRAKHTHLTAVRSLGAEAKDIMITHPMTVSLNSTIRHTANLMMKHRFDRVCVIDKGKLVGVISKRDLISQLPHPKTFT